VEFRRTYVATSRRRERELARRRFERRRQAELERRAHAKRRNTIIGASAGTAAVIAGVVILVIALSGGNGKAKVTSNNKPTPTPSASAQPAPKTCAPIKPNPPAKGEPKVPPVTGKDPTKLVTKDIKAGSGKPAKAGDQVTVKYVGVACSDGKAFDASYTDGAKNQEFSFKLGAGQVIQGWDQGIVGMKPGGVRELIIPGPLAYQASPSNAPTFGADTLIFVVTMVKA
jgi:peptidylprolyl isomerase